MPQVPTAPVSALSATRNDGISVLELSDLDERTGAELIRVGERHRRQATTFLAVAMAPTYIGLTFAAISPIFFILAAGAGLLGSGVSFVGLQTIKASYVAEAEGLGVSRNVALKVRKRLRRISGRVPRWVKGEERVTRIAAAMRETSL